MFSFLLLCAVSTAAALCLDDRRIPSSCGYESCTSADPNMLNVHIVPHTHDDVGWLKTVDQYYYGSRNNIQKAGVQYILDSVVKELWEDPKRRFIYVETAFFWKWWVLQTDKVKSRVHTLVRQGRLQFVGGAWSMNDEAASHYQSTIDQFTWGLSKLNQTFGECARPRVGWQIDPFGHSREFASLLAAMGYDGLFLGRLDYQDKRNRLQKKTMEMLWRGDDDLGKPSDIFTGVLHNNYSPPPGFCFDVLCSDEPIVDDPNSPMFNVDERVGQFLNFSFIQAQFYRTSNVILTLGGDFTYQDAGMWYKNLDKLIEYANIISAKDKMNIKLFYSTPDCYLKAIKDAQPTLPIKQDDFFPYASDPTAYWTGYFSSRPTTKYYERQGNSYLQMVKQLQVLANLEQHNMFVIDELKSALGIWQHHDAITGTEKQHVTSDYERIMSEAIDGASIVVQQAFNKVMQGSASAPPKLNWTTCHLNESRCDTSETSQQFVVTVYNHLAWHVNDSIRIPVADGQYTVYAPNGEQIEFQLVEIPSKVLEIQPRYSIATHEIVFVAYLKPVSFNSYYIKYTNKVKRDVTDYPNTNYQWGDVKQQTTDEAGVELKSFENIKSKLNPANSNDLVTDLIDDDSKKRDDERHSKMNPRTMWASNDDKMRMMSDQPMIVERFDDNFDLNQPMQVQFDEESKQIHITRPDGSIVRFSINFLYYKSATGDNSNYEKRSSGAYILRPTLTDPITAASNYSQTNTGPIVNETKITFENGASVVRFYKGLKYIEHNWVVGPIDISDDIGKEYIVRYFTEDIVNNGEFYTDSNGRQMLKRKLNQRPLFNVTLQEPVPGNYYPVVNRIYIEDAKNKISVLTDRSEGGTSLLEGQIELMLHRRCLHDDAFGVGEALNEIGSGLGLIARGTHRILISDPNDVEDSIEERKQVLQYHLQPQVFVANAEDVSLEEWMNLTKCYSWVNELPNGVHLLTLEPWHGSSLLLRLENYLELNDKEDTTVEVCLDCIFKTLKLKSFKETTLAANQWLEDQNKWSWYIESEFSESFNKEYGSLNYVNRAKEPKVAQDDGFKIKLAAKQIRTFIVDYEQ